MKRLVKILVAIVVVSAVAVGGLVATISALHAKSRREITKVVSEIRPGTSFTDIAAQLGRESQTLSNAAEIRAYGETPGVATNLVLHLFIHGDIPPRWICIYTDCDSRNVFYATWRDM